MLFICVEDFFETARNAHRLTRDEEKLLAEKMRNGCAEARQAIIESYLPFVAGYILRAPATIHTLDTVYRCIDSLEKGVDTFPFQQEGETFLHHLSWRMRQCITACIANR